MALDPKILLQPDILGASLWMTNKTGAYVTTTNEGGFGSPNPALNTMALAAVIVYNAATASQLVVKGLAVKYNAAAADTDEDYFEFTYGLDGWHTAVMFVLPVSNDGVNDLNSNVLVEGDYFYYLTTSKVCVLTAGVPVEVTDYSVMIDDAGLVQIKCERLYMVDSAVKLKDLYREYKILRDTRGQCKETEVSWRKHWDLFFQVVQAYNAFWSGLMTEAHDIAETIIKEYKLT